MFYDNKVCDGCSEVMLEGDDIVVCPECGTPQHRECYNKNNECVNAHLHAEGFDWREAHKADETPEPPSEEKPDNAEFAGAQNEPPLSNAEYSSREERPNTPPMPEFRIDGVYIKGQTYDADEDLGGATVREVVTYTQINFKHYIKRLVKNRNKKSFFLSWNWGAFFFGPAWFFYRKLYKLGIIFLALAVSATIAVSPLIPAVSDAAAKLEPLYTEWYDAIEANSSSPTEETQAEVDRLSAEIMATGKKALPYTLAIFGASYLIAQIIPALIANYFYRQKMMEDIKFAKQATSDPGVLRYSLMRRGGVSFLAGLLANLAATYLPEIILSIVGYIN